MNLNSLQWYRKFNKIYFEEFVMDDKKRLGLKIRTIRKSKKITQEKLSEMVCISPRQMVKIEMGYAFPSVENLQKIAAALEVSIQALFENDYYDCTETLKEKLIEKINILDERNTKFLYIVASNLD